MDAEAAKSPRLSCLCFSKDRPLQLEGYIKSLKACASEPVALSVLFKAGSPAFEEAYAKLAKENPDVAFMPEQDFKSDLESWLGSAPELLMFGCDDVVFKEPFDLAMALGAFDGRKSLAGFSLRLGLSLNYSITTARAMSKPKFLQTSPFLLWDRTKAQIDWNYPFELDCTIYRKSFVEAILAALRALEAQDRSFAWGHPNKLEAGAAKIMQLSKQTLTLMAAFPSSKASVVTVNRVQDAAQNQFFDQNGALSPEKLLELWNAGAELDIDAYRGRSYRSIHISEMLLRDKRDPARRVLPEEPCDEIRDIILSCADHKRKFNPKMAASPDFPGYLMDFFNYFNMPGAERTQPVMPQPQLGDKTPSSTVDPIYFHQDTWCFERAYKAKPARIVDVGSTVLLVGIMSKLAPTESVDIRPVQVKLPGLSCRKGSIDALPYPDKSVEFLSSICVIEHIGLGRYGDALDPQGSAKALREVSRAIAHGGHFACSLPISSEPFVCFNAHRILTRDYVLSFFPDFELEDELLLHPEPVPMEELKGIEPFDFAVWCFDLKRK